MNLFRKVIVSWGNTNSPPPKMLFSAARLHEVWGKVIIRQEKADDLNLRFMPPIENDDTKCVFIADDDIFVSESDVLLTYHTWKDHTDQIIGTFPRGHRYDENQQLLYDSDPKDQYSMILTKFMVTSVDFLHHYHSGTMAGVRSYVRNQQNCEDIAFNMMVSKLTNLPPVYVQIPNKVDFGSRGGLFTRPKHVQQRHDCVCWLSGLFGECPLKFSSLSISKFQKDEYVHSQDGAEEVIHTLVRRDKAIDSTQLRVDILSVATRYRAS